MSDYENAWRPNHINATGGSTGGQPEPAEAEVEFEEVETSKPYAEWTVAELSDEAEGRGLAKSGTKDELIGRLEASDTADAEAEA
jgi:hypothetical protein